MPACGEKPDTQADGDNEHFPLKTAQRGFPQWAACQSLPPRGLEAGVHRLHVLAELDQIEGGKDHDEDDNDPPDRPEVRAKIFGGGPSSFE